MAVYDTGEDVLDGDGEHLMVPYIVMEYVDGHAARVDEQRAPSSAERSLGSCPGCSSAWTTPTPTASSTATSKPGNVMLNRNGDVKVMDFGIARAVADAQATMTQGNAVMGTAQYLSPSRRAANSSTPVPTCTPRAVCSTNCSPDGPVPGETRCLSGLPARQRATSGSVVGRSGGPARPRRLVLKSLAKNPADRYQSANEFKADVERAMAGLPVTGTIPTVRATVPASANTAAMSR